MGENYYNRFADRTVGLHRLNADNWAYYNAICRAFQGFKVCVLFDRRASLIDFLTSVIFPYDAIFEWIGYNDARVEFRNGSEIFLRNYHQSDFSLHRYGSPNAFLLTEELMDEYILNSVAETIRPYIASNNVHEFETMKLRLSNIPDVCFRSGDIPISIIDTCKTDNAEEESISKELDDFLSSFKIIQTLEAGA